MDSQGHYDYAILGEGLASWVSALLLSRQGDRVVIIPDRPEKREFLGRILFGLERDGILLQMLEHWGISKTLLAGKKKARMECLTPDVTLWVQGSLAEKGLGNPAFELQGPGYDRLLRVVEAMEGNPQWKATFQSEFVARVRRTTGSRLQWIPFLPDTAAIWRAIVRKVVSAQLKGVRLPRESTLKKDGATGLLRGLGSLLSRDGSWQERSSQPIQVASDLYALRNAYFSDEIFDDLKLEFRKILRASGVDFLEDEARPHFKRDSSGTWEGFYDANQKEQSMRLFRFENFILTRPLEPESFARFEAGSRKLIELDFDPKEIDRYQTEIRFRENPFPFREAAELVSRSPSGGWLRLSVYQDPAPCLRVGAWIPADDVSTRGDVKIVTERRLLREIRESLPSLQLEADQVEISTQVHRERKFRKSLGVKGKSPRVWHAHHESYPRMGEYGPLLAAIEIARRRARKKKRVLPI